MRKPIIKEFNFIKAVCAFGIIAFHFSCHLTSRDFLPVYDFENGSWGAVFVAVFFIVSGALLYYHYADKPMEGLSIYFYKRWKSIFPMYYIAYIYFEVQNIIEHKSLMFRGELWRYVYTLFGMDGYLSQNVTTYYILGEWFTGAIILLYILFPLILRFFTKNDKFVFLVTLILYVIFLDKPIINPVSYWSITSCLISFVCGMMLMRYREHVLNGWCILVSAIGFLVLWFVKVPLSIDVSIHLIGVFLFVILCFVGKYLMENNFFNKIFTELSSISYAVFLLQHITILEVLGAWNPSNPVKILILLICTMVLILCQAKALTLVTNAFVKKMDSIILKHQKNKNS